MTKTINEFVESFYNKYEFHLFLEKENEKIILVEGICPVITLNRGGWAIEREFSELRPDIQKYIMDYVYNSEPKDWFGDDEDDEIIVDGIQMTKAQADQLYEYFTKKQSENLNKEMNRLKDHFDKVRDLWNM